MAKEKTAVERMEFIKIEEASKIIRCADLMMEGTPICLDFRELKNSDAERCLNFLQGVNYATDGNVVELKDKVYVFATKRDLRDASMKDFIKEYKEN